MCHSKLCDCKGCCIAAYLVVADEKLGRQIPFAFLDKVKAEFAEKHAETSRTLHAHSLDKIFGCGILLALKGHLSC